MKSNHRKTILDLCGGTGAWSKPYEEAGYDVINITLPDFALMKVKFPQKTEREIQYLFFKYENKAGWLAIPIKYVYGVLAAPTCTMFSLARTTAKTPRDLEGGFELVHKCLEIIWRCRYSGGLKFWALENPSGYLRQLLGKPPLTFDPCDYGDTYTKKTDLWGYYNFPKKNRRKLTKEEKERCSINARKLPGLPKDYVLPKDFKPQQARRSMTSSKFAEAFFKANK